MNKTIQNIVDTWREPIVGLPVTCSICNRPFTEHGVFDCGCFDDLERVNVCMDQDEWNEERRGADEISNA